MPQLKNHEFRCALAATALNQSGGALANAFKNASFIYGTSGAVGNMGGKVVKEFWLAGIRNNRRSSDEARRNLVSRAMFQKLQSRADNARVAVARKNRRSPEVEGLALFEPGQRAIAYLENGWQMMDMYYGQHGTESGILHTHRIPVIGEFVHRAMQFNGAYKHDVPGWKSYLETWPAANPGWWSGPIGELYGADLPVADRVKWSPTKEISRIIRWGISHFGGTIYFEGAEVPYRQVFLVNPLRHGDTEAEARAMFPHFVKGADTHPMGKGNIVSMWCGKKTPFYKTHFLVSWCFNADPVGAAVNNLPESIRLVNTLPVNSTSDLINLAVEDDSKSGEGPLILPIWNNFEPCLPEDNLESVGDLVDLFHQLWYANKKTKLKQFLDQRQP